MNFVSQNTPTLQLMDLANSRHHSILIEGPQGCGKTYLAKQYAAMLNVSDFEVVKCSVDTIRDAIDETCKIKNDVVICLENLDDGVLSASYTILKFLEEPLPNVYIVVTCRNLKKVPDTIISRSSRSKSNQTKCNGTHFLYIKNLLHILLFLCDTFLFFKVSAAKVLQIEDNTK